jgi:hypothetical protein
MEWNAQNIVIGIPNTMVPAPRFQRIRSHLRIMTIDGSVSGALVSSATRRRCVIQLRTETPPLIRCKLMTVLDFCQNRRVTIAADRAPFITVICRDYSRVCAFSGRIWSFTPIYN